MIQGHGWTRTRGMRGVRTIGAALALAGLLAAGAVGNTGVVRAQDMATPEAVDGSWRSDRERQRAW